MFQCRGICIRRQRLVDELTAVDQCGFQEETSLPDAKQDSHRLAPVRHPAEKDGGSQKLQIALGRRGAGLLGRMIRAGVAKFRL